jgi:uncharacterized damage-inducible protein DinB
MTSIRAIRPPADEFPPAFAGYVAQAPDGDIVDTLERECQVTLSGLRTLDEAQAGYRYAPGKWSIKELLGHLADAERVFAYRAMTYARGDEGPLPGFDENAYVPAQENDTQPLARLVDQFATGRAATISLLAALPPAAWTRRGIANGKLVSVRALAWVIAGHEVHHRRVLEERYLGKAT